MTTAATSGRILVGYDGRWQANRLLDEAAEEAVRRQLPLTVLTLIHGIDEVASLEGRPADGRTVRTVVRHRLAEAARHIHARRPDLRVATQYLYFAEVAPDLEPFSSCALLVLGDRGNHGTPPFGVGSASLALSSAVSCPVLTVPESGPNTLTPRSALHVARGGTTGSNVTVDTHD